MNFHNVKARLEVALDDIACEIETEQGYNLPNLTGEDMVKLARIDRLLDDLACMILDLYN